MLAAAPRDLTHQRPRAALVLVALVLACHAAGALGALVTDAAWYRELARPSWAPPGWVFGPVWLTLYTMMGVAAWRVWRTPSGPARSRALGWFAAQLALNAAWTPVFFGLRSLGGGLVVIGLLVVAIAGTIRAFRVVAPPAPRREAPVQARGVLAHPPHRAPWGATTASC